MPRSMVGRLAAVGTAMSALAGPARGDIAWIAIADAAVATSLVVCATAPFNRFPPYIYGVIHLRTRCWLATGSCQGGRFAARVSGLAFAPALAVRARWVGRDTPGL